MREPRLDESTSSFSEVVAFKIPQKWMSETKDTLLELYLSEIAGKTMRIDVQWHNFPNLTKKERREAFQELMNDYNIMVNEQSKKWNSWIE